MKLITHWFELGRETARETFVISRDLFKIMVPVLLLVKAVELLGGTGYLAAMISPLMASLGLPPEMGVVWAGTLLSNIYTGMVLFVSEPVAAQLSVLQVTVLGILMLVAHALPVELSVARKIGVSLLFGLLLRMVTAWGAAWIYYRLMLLGGYQQVPADILWTPAVRQGGLADWALTQLRLMGQIVLIIAALVVLLRLIRRYRLDRLIHLGLRPLLPLVGLTDKAINVVLVGMTLGLSYGGGLLIQESRQGVLEAREMFFSVCLLLLCHGLIEDTLLILLLGADIIGILLFRVIFSLCLVAAMVYALRGREEAFYRRYLLNRNFRTRES